jgi:RNA polymerase sigma-70 factor (sigma-E family)
MRKRDEDGFASFATAQWFALYRTAFLLCGDHQLAEDLVQATLTKMYLGWRRIAAMEQPNAYARKVLVNQATSWGRRRSASELPTDLGIEAQQTGFADSVAQSVVVWNAVLALPPRQRAVIVLKYYDDLTIAEISDSLQMAQGTVKSHLYEARRSLEARLGEAANPVVGGEAT